MAKNRVIISIEVCMYIYVLSIAKGTTKASYYISVHHKSAN